LSHTFVLLAIVNIGYDDDDDD